jgi:23S rRNA (cytidine1920-2'-O)/16S rRNA (cytidine1409-2'-O)-methyltransferase
MKTRRESLIDILAQRYPKIRREELYASIMCGEVRIGSETVRDPRAQVDPSVPVAFVRQRFVSRGGEKLSAALNAWGIAVRDKVILDAGCSTGGFTDALLQNGASRVYAVDVGYNQIDYRLRTDPRVILRERTNIMTLEPGSLSPPPHGAVADLSFRSLAGAAVRILSLTTEGWCVALGKPQFEIDEPTDDFHGVVRARTQVFDIMISLFARLRGEGVLVRRVMASPLLGRKGNREFLLFLTMGDPNDRETAREAVEELGRALDLPT